ncbi:SRPBCC family protein [Streptomyces collinus]|uniref:SRPBCC family protein n=1 Tax=Streptomyces collinus TaxID=42684 RepID=UPI0033FE2B31
MTSTTGPLGSAAGKATGAAKDNPVTELVHSEAADRLKGEVQDYLSAQAERLLSGLGRKLGETTLKLNDIADGKSPGFAKLALDGGRKLAEGKGPLRTALELGTSRAKDKVMDAVKNIGGGKGKRKSGGGNKPTVILESIDVGVPVRTAYDQWTRFQDFSVFAKGVKSASRASDTDSDWQAKIWWSSRSWKAHTTEQLPDYRIQWTSEGAKGTVKGVVTFHPLGENLTRVLLIMEYYPSGFFEKTGNIWRAQGRRARLDLKHYARHISMKGEAEDGWRGEIRDGEVVKSHEDAVAEEEQESQESGDEGSEEPEGRGSEEPEEGEEAGESEEYEDEAEEPYEDEDAEGAEADEEGGEYEDEADDEPYGEEAPEDEQEYDEEADEAGQAGEAGEDEEYEDEEEPEYAGGGRSRR